MILKLCNDKAILQCIILICSFVQTLCGVASLWIAVRYADGTSVFGILLESFSCLMILTGICGCLVGYNLGLNRLIAYAVFQGLFAVLTITGIVIYNLEGRIFESPMIVAAVAQSIATVATVVLTWIIRRESPSSSDVIKV